MACSTPCCVHDRSHPLHVTRELQLYSMLRSRSLTSTTAFASATTCANCAATHTDVCGAVCWTRSCARFCARHMLTTHLSTALPPTFQSSHSRRCVSKGRLRCARPSSSPPRVHAPIPVAAGVFCLQCIPISPCLTNTTDPKPPCVDSRCRFACLRVERSTVATIRR
jgi:hypothetical protein